MSHDNSNFTEDQGIPKGYKKTEIGFTPKEWELVKLGDISEVKMCKRVLSHQTKKNGVIPFFKIGTFGAQADSYISKSLYDEYRAKYSFPESGDILVSAAGTLGKTVVYDGKPSYFQDSNIVWLKVDKSKVINEYLYHYYKVIKWASTEGTTIARLYNGIIYDTQILLPSINEQKTIAAALSDTDALISELEKLIEKKQAIKTATMQQLLTGKTRLPEFTLREDGTPKGYKKSELGRIPEDWEVIQFDKHIEKIIGGGTPSRSIASYWGQDIPWVTVKDFATFDPNSAQEYITNQGLKSSASNLIPAGTLITSTRMALGKALIYQVDVAINQDLKAIFTKPSLDTTYLKYWFDNNAKKIDELGSGSTVKGISLPDLKTLPFIEMSLLEQLAIKNILISIDNDLSLLKQRYEKTKSIKKGMMQELLTGKTRLV